MTPKGPRAAIYVRLSRDRVGETATARQEADARALAAARGFTVAEVFSDVDLSAYRAGVVRPAYERMLAAARAGELDAVVVWKVDRLARSLREFVRVTELLDAEGVALVSVNESLDTSSPMGRAMLQIIGVFAELESATISLRTRNAKAHGAALGQPNGGGRRPFGYTDHRFAAIVEPEAELLREAARRLLDDGASLRSIAADWNARGLTTTTGTPWSSSSLGRTLRGPHLAGMRRHGEKVIPGTWPAIFSADEHAAIVAAAGHHRAAKLARHLLTGLVRCSLCGSAMRGKTTRRFGFQYACFGPGCGRLVVNGRAIEEVVAGAALAALESPEMTAALGAREDTAAVRAVAEALAADREAFEQLSRDHYVDRVIPREAFLAAAGVLESRIAAGESRLARRQVAAGPLAPGQAVRDAWDAGDPATRRRLLDAVLTAVIVKPAERRGPARNVGDRLDLRWRA